MSTLKTNTLTGTTSAGSIDVTGEGGSTTTNLQQGLVKCWVHYDQKGDSGSTQVLDSFNETSVLDVGDGQYRVNVTNNFNNAFHATGAISIDSGEHVGFHCEDNGDLGRPDAWCQSCEDSWPSFNGDGDAWFGACDFKVVCCGCWDLAKNRQAQ